MDDTTVSAPARAKLNLFLEVTERRGDGFHNIDSVFVEIDLADTVRATRVKSNRSILLCDNPDLPLDAKNLALRAALLLHEHAGVFRKGLDLRLSKNIPCGSGLGGGSSDAATVLRLANRLWECGLTDEELLPLAEKLGSDVPFFLRGGTCRCEGKGERITPLPDFPKDIEFGLALPPFPSSTAQAYANLNLPRAAEETRRADPFIDAMADADVAAMRRLAFNRFEETVFPAMPQLGRLHADLEELLGHPARLSGTGSGLWFFAEKGWRDNAALRSWASANSVTLFSARAAASSPR